MSPQDVASREGRLDALIEGVAKYRARRHSFELSELRNEAWAYAHDPVRTATVESYLRDGFRSKNAQKTRGEARLWAAMDKHLSEYVAQVHGELPRSSDAPTYGGGQQAVQINGGPGNSRRIYWDADPGDSAPFANGIDPLEAFPSAEHDDEDGTTPGWKRGFSWLKVAPEGDRKRLGPPYGAKQVFPFGILNHARDLGIISEYQVTLLTFLMEGDSATDLANRYPEESSGAIQAAVYRALVALRKEPKVQEWAQSLGHNPLATKGPSWESEHRHCDGRPAEPASARPFECTCSRGEADYDEHALDRSDPFARLLPSGVLAA